MSNDYAAVCFAFGFAFLAWMMIDVMWDEIVYDDFRHRLLQSFCWILDRGGYALKGEDGYLTRNLVN